VFTGAINQQVRAVLAELAPLLRDLPVYVGCSGNFTVERVLAKAGLTSFHSNDVSLYSCAVGSYLAGNSLSIGIADPEFDWLQPYLSPGVPSIAALLLCTEMFQYYGRREPYHQRMWNAYRSRFETMHRDTMTKAEKALDGVKLDAFWPGDVVDFVTTAPDEAAVVCFPPTYKGGYERMYRLMDGVFSWDAPFYTTFDDSRFLELSRAMSTKAAWVTMRDQPVPELTVHLRAMVQTTVRSRPVYVYSGTGKARLAMPRQKLEPVPLSRLEGEMGEPLRLLRLTAGQLNSLRSQYLDPSIPPAGAQVNLALASGEALIGAFSFVHPLFTGEWCNAYMMADFAVRPTVYKRLAKLVLAAALSYEVKAVLEQSFNRPVRTIGTTAFTDKPVSMKYRGIFDLHSRKEGRLNYLAPTGRWSLEEGLAWWRNQHSQTA
jgi:hypothetical protein